MKVISILVLVFLSMGQLHADEFRFWLNRFGGIFIETTKGKEHVQVFQGNKQSEETIFESRLIPSGPGTYATPKGTVFTLKHLRNSIINDGNRHINSGDWQLTVAGKGNEFESLKPKMPFVAFGELPNLIYLGEKTE